MKLSEHPAIVIVGAVGAVSAALLLLRGNAPVIVQKQADNSANARIQAATSLAIQDAINQTNINVATIGANALKYKSDKDFASTSLMANAYKEGASVQANAQETSAVIGGFFKVLGGLL